jgi:hypothetical protein
MTREQELLIYISLFSGIEEGIGGKSGRDWRIGTGLRSPFSPLYNLNQAIRNASIKTLIDNKAIKLVNGLYHVTKQGKKFISQIKKVNKTSWYLIQYITITKGYNGSTRSESVEMYTLDEAVKFVKWATEQSKYSNIQITDIKILAGNEELLKRNVIIARANEEAKKGCSLKDLLVRVVAKKYNTVDKIGNMTKEVVNYISAKS